MISPRSGQMTKISRAEKRQYEMLRSFFSEEDDGAIPSEGELLHDIQQAHACELGEYR